MDSVTHFYYKACTPSASSDVCSAANDGDRVSAVETRLTRAKNLLDKLFCKVLQNKEPAEFNTGGFLTATFDHDWSLRVAVQKVSTQPPGNDGK